MARIVKTFTLLLSLVSCTSKAYYTEIALPSYEKHANEIMATLSKEVKKEYGCIAYSTGGSMPDKVRHISVGFHVYKSVTIEEARETFVLIKEKLIQLMNTHEGIRPYLINYPCTSDMAHINLAFYKKNGNRQPGVAFVCEGKGILYYDTIAIETIPQTSIIEASTGKISRTFPAREEERLVDLFEEPYEEALKIVRAKHPPTTPPESTPPKQT